MWTSQGASWPASSGLQVLVSGQGRRKPGSAETRPGSGPRAQGRPTKHVMLPGFCEQTSLVGLGCEVGGGGPAQSWEKVSFKILEANVIRYLLISGDGICFSPLSCFYTEQIDKIK